MGKGDLECQSQARVLSDCADEAGIGIMAASQYIRSRRRRLIEAVAHSSGYEDLLNFMTLMNPSSLTMGSRYDVGRFINHVSVGAFDVVEIPRIFNLNVIDGCRHR